MNFTTRKFLNVSRFVLLLSPVLTTVPPFSPTCHCLIIASVPLSLSSCIWFNNHTQEPQRRRWSATLTCSSLSRGCLQIQAAAGTYMYSGKPLSRSLINKGHWCIYFSEFSTKFKNGQNLCSNGVKFRGFHSMCTLYWVHLSLPVYFMLASFVNLYIDFTNRSLLTLTKTTTTSGS